MPRDGSGTFTLPAGNPVVNGTTIDPTVHNNTMADMALGFTNSLAKDGQTSPTANLPMAGFTFTNMANAAARTSPAAAGQVQDCLLMSLGSVAGTDTITGSLTPALAAYVANQYIVFRPVAANTGAVTINVNGLGARAIQKFGANALVANDLLNGIPAVIVYDGAAFQLLNPRIQIADAVGTTQIVNDAVTNAKLANMAQATVKGRQAAAGTGDPEDLTAAQLVTILLGADGAGSLLDADLLDGQSGAFYQDAGNLNAGTLAAARLSSGTNYNIGAGSQLNGVDIGYRDVVRRTSGFARGECTSISAGITLNTSDMAAGRAFTIYNNSGSSITITQGAGVTLRLGGTATTGNRTLAQRGICTIWCESGTEAVISGSGVS